MDLSHYIPRRLDDTGKFLFWELDIAALGLLGTLLGIAVGFPVVGSLSGIMLAFIYSKLKTGKHPGMATHILYWSTGMPGTQALPGSHLREFNG